MKPQKENSFRSKADVSSERLTYNLRVVWLLIGVGIILVALGYVLGSMATVIWAIVAAALVVFILKAPVEWLEKRGVPRAVSSAVLTIALLSIIIAVFVSLLPMFIDQLVDLLGKLPGYIDQLQQWLASFAAQTSSGGSSFQDFLGQISNIVREGLSSLQSILLNNAYSWGVSLVNILITGIMAFIVAFWILVDYHKMAHEVHALMGSTAHWYSTLVGTIFSRVLSGYIKGTLIGAVIISLACGVGYWLLGLEFALALAILVGLLSIVPYIGPFLAAIVVGVVSLFSGVFVFIFALVVTLLVPWLVGTFISPRVMSATVNLHPGVSILAIIAGGALGGILGMIVGIPVVAVLKCLLVYFFEATTGKRLVTEDGAFFKGHPGPNIDPVADATDNYLTEQELYQRVNTLQNDIPKVEDFPRRTRTRSLFREIAQPMRVYAENARKESAHRHDAQTHDDGHDAETHRDGLDPQMHDEGNNAEARDDGSDTQGHVDGHVADQDGGHETDAIDDSRTID